MEEITSQYKSYMEYKNELDQELRKSAEGFVKIGFLLKVARDTNILEGTPYKTVNEFAQGEYSIDKTTVSRFIRINDSFSVNGNSEVLQEQYRGYGYAKLTIMLQIPDAINEELSTNYSKTEIQAIKEEVDKEKQQSEIEILLEEKNEVQEQMSEVIQKVLHQFGHDEPQLYLKWHEAVMKTVYNDGSSMPVIRKLVECLAPAGEAIYSTRIQGVGRMMLTIKGADTNPTIINVRSGEKEPCSWNKLIRTMESLCTGGDGKKSWEALYTEPFPVEKEEVAPVQRSSEHKTETKKTETKKVSKVTKAKERIKEIFEDKAEEKEPEVQLPGQMDIKEFIGDTKEEDADENENQEEDEKVAVSADALEDTADVSEDSEDRELVIDSSSGSSTDIVDGSVEGLIREAFKLNDDIWKIIEDWKPVVDITEKELKEAKVAAEKLSEVFEQLLQFAAY